MFRMVGIWALLGTATHLAGACATATLAAWLAGRRDRFGPAGTALVVALALTALWALVEVLAGGMRSPADMAEALRNLGWLFLLHRLFRDATQQGQMRPVRVMLAALAALELVQLAVALMMLVVGPDRLLPAMVPLRLMLCIGALVLLHNLYGAASRQARLALRWPASALVLLWGYDLNFYSVALLGQGWPAELAALRGFSALALVLALVPGLTGRREELRFSPSRAVAFEFASLVGIAAYLAGMVLLSRWLGTAGGTFARAFQFGFLIAGLGVVLLALPSRRLRGWLKVMLTKHFFQHRYDYRAEWLRFTRTIGRIGDEAPPLEERVIQAVCDITDSPAGLLLVPGDGAELVLAANWQWHGAGVPAQAMAAEAIAFFARGRGEGGFIVDCDAVRMGLDRNGEGAILPPWLVEDTRAWVLVPLLHFDRLTGVVVLARPPVVRKLDWEDFDLLGVVGRQLASYLAEHAGQDALAEAARFDEFNRRIAFVMHDIKNLASQFTLLARNAERHAENPAFRADMLVTLRNSADKLNALLARLSRYGTGHGERPATLDAGALLGAVTERFARNAIVTAVATAHRCWPSARRWNRRWFIWCRMRWMPAAQVHACC